MSIEIIPRYVVQKTAGGSFYVLDQAESPAKTAAIVPPAGDPERVRAGLELIYALELTAQAEDEPPIDVTGAAV